MILQLDWYSFMLTSQGSWQCGTDSARNLWATDLWWLFKVQNSSAYTQGQLIYG